jgi:hypothetical protein
MRHLSDAELVDAADYSLTPARSAHLDSCDRCRAAVDRLASMLREASTVDVPEPSPLFWDHFSARVHNAVAVDGAAAAHRGWAPRWAPWVQVAAFCAIVVAVVSAAWFVRPSGDATRVSTTASRTDTRTAPAVPNAPREIADAADDPAWAVLSAAAADLSSESNRGVSNGVTPSVTFTVRPAAVDTALQQLTPDERRELGALLQSELKRSGD